MKHFERGLPAGLLAALVLLLWPAKAGGQEQLAQLDSRPRFMQPAPGGGAPREIDVTQVALLRRRVSLNRERATVGQMLQEISRQTGLLFAYKADVLPLDRVVGLRADSITVAAALTEILVDAGVDVLLKSPRQAVLLRRSDPVQTGSVAGRVTDAKSEEAVPGAEVYLEGTRWRTATGEDGRYRLAEVEVGNYTLTVRRIGYAKRSRAMTVAPGEEVTVDVALEAVPTQLNEIVTTVTGDQRRLELGHVVGRINADSLVKEAPISSLSELLTARVPGLQVYQSQGTVGGDVRLQVRGPNSLLLSTEPLVIVDGVRHTAGPAPGATAAEWPVEAVSPLNDINPNDIESIEVVKGPSAATLYGTDAANGVIVITTKRGSPGPARWNAYARGTTTRIPTLQYNDQYWGWHTVDGAPSLTRTCDLFSVASGSCTQDSVTVLPSPLLDPEMSIFRSAPSWEYGGGVAGGREDLRYFFASDFQQATGGIRMPPAIANELRAQRGVSDIPEEQLDPNALTKLSVRGNVTASFGETAELHVQTGYVHRKTRSLGLSGESPYAEGVFLRTPADPYGRDGSDPAAAFSETSTETADRFFGSANLQWRPASWLTTRATVGVDLGARNRYSILRRGDAPNHPVLSTGAVGDTRARQTAITGELGATLTLRADRLSSRTSAGAQYVRNLNDVLAVTGRGLPPGGTSIGEAESIRTPQQIYGETVTLGSYVEQTFGLNERLYLTGALRIDGASTFGQNYDAALYPKVSASWLASQEPFFPRVPGLDELRLRYAFGASGQQPQHPWSHFQFGKYAVSVDGTQTTAIGVDGLGNPDLRPERVREHEFGFDAAALQNRLQLGLTWYHRRTVDQIVFASLPPGLGYIYTNVGLTKQHGFELELRAQLLETRAVTLDVMAQHALHRTEVLDLGSAGAALPAREGYSIDARFQRPILGYNDANGDGIIEPLEVQMGDSVQYFGESTPPISRALGAVLGLFGRRVRVSALFERRTGFTQVDRLRMVQCNASRCRERVDPSTPLAEQAEIAALARSYKIIEPGDFTRFRELSVAVEMPPAVARAVRARSASLSVSGRNLALWTDYPGPDPESAALRIGEGIEADGIPQARSWTVRVDLGF